MSKIETWTFVNDYKGGTYVNQTHAPTLFAALQWYAGADVGVKPAWFEADEGYFDAVPIEDTESVWCTSAFDFKKQSHMTITVVKTATSPQLHVVA